jgi:SAM-dependent methyltransferase
MAHDGVDARCGYAQCMPFPDASFDVVVASEVLEHIEPNVRKDVLREIARVLDIGGWFVGSVPYRENLSDSEVICPDCGKIFHRWGHVSSFDLASLAAELAREFTDVACRRCSFVDWAGARTPGRWLKCAVQAALGRLGEPIASPSIAFAARRGATGNADRG